MIPKFRAWYTPFKGKKFGQEMKYGQAGSLITHAEMSPDNYVLMQSTGLKNCEDINGAKCESWEGDIAEVGWSDETGEYYSHTIVLKNPFEYTADEIRWLINCYYITILGNIYENSELLKK